MLYSALTGVMGKQREGIVNKGKGVDNVVIMHFFRQTQSIFMYAVTRVWRASSGNV